jgi:hypothetical protein
LKRKKR